MSNNIDPFVIQNKSIEELANHTAKFLTKFNRFLYASPAELDTSEKADIKIKKAVIEKLYPQAKSLAKEAEILRKTNGNKWDHIIRFHTSEMINGVVAYLDYYYVNEKHKHIDSLIDFLFGKRFKDDFRSELLKFDFKEKIELTKNHRQIKKITNYDEKKKYLAPVLDILVPEFYKYSSAHFRMPNKISAELTRENFVDVVMHNSIDGSSLMSNDDQTVYIDPNDGIDIYHGENDSIIVNAASIPHILFHEIMGHYRRLAFSENLPNITRAVDSNYSFASASHDEAFAMNAEKKSIDFIRHNPKLNFELNKDGEILRRFDLSSNEKNSEEWLVRNWEMENNFMKYFIWVTERIEDGSFDYSRDIEPFTKIETPHNIKHIQMFHPKVYKQDPLAYKEESMDKGIIKWSDVYGLPTRLSYRKGIFLWDRSKRHIANKYGKKYVEEQKEFIDDILMTGNWACRAFPLFLDYAIEHKDAFYKLINK